MLLLACERLEVIANETPEDITICVGMLDRARVVRVRPLHYLLKVDRCGLATLFASAVGCPSELTAVVIVAFLPPLFSIGRQCSKILYSSSCLAMQLPLLKLVRG